MKKEILLTPGPSQVPARVRAAEARPAIHHRGDEFKKIYAKLHTDLKELLNTSGDVFIFGSSGTGAMEACVANTLSRGDRVVVGNTGKFGERFVEINRAYGVEVVEIKKEWGGIITPQELDKVLSQEKNIRAVFITHSETSSGVMNPIDELGKVAAAHDALFIVDSISAIGGLEIRMDDWGIDMLAAGSQKALMIPPGLAFVAVREKIWKAYERSDLPKYYFDIKAYKDSLDKGGECPYTIPVSLCLALSESMAMMREEGFEKIYARHRRLALAARAGVAAMGLEFFSPHQSFVETVFRVPAGIDGIQLVRTVRDKFGIRLSGGQSPYKGKIVRIAHMGYVTEQDILLAVSALEMTLKELGFPVTLGSGIRAAEEILLKN
ncbi:MAG: alanine--glyoxylate aminotransferase family protein [bacterium]